MGILIYDCCTGYLFFAVALCIFIMGWQTYDNYQDAHTEGVNELCDLTTANMDVPINYAMGSSITLASQTMAAWKQMGGPLNGNGGKFNGLISKMQACPTESSLNCTVGIVIPLLAMAGLPGHVRATGPEQCTIW